MDGARHAAAAAFFVGVHARERDPRHGGGRPWRFAHERAHARRCFGGLHLVVDPLELCSRREQRHRRQRCFQAGGVVLVERAPARALHGDRDRHVAQRVGGDVAQCHHHRRPFGAVHRLRGHHPHRAAGVGDRQAFGGLHGVRGLRQLRLLFKLRALFLAALASAQRERSRAARRCASRAPRRPAPPRPALPTPNAGPPGAPSTSRRLCSCVPARGPHPKAPPM